LIGGLLGGALAVIVLHFTVGREVNKWLRQKH
jgi:hypothetical protein